MSQTRTPDFRERLEEIGLFFDGNDKVHRALRTIAGRLEAAGIPYAIAGGMAVNALAARRTTEDVDLLLNEGGLARFRGEFAGTSYDQVAGRPRRFSDRENGVALDILVAGRYPGRGTPGPIAFPDPTEAAAPIDGLNVLTLPVLVRWKLAARRYYDFGDVVSLIRVHDLDESFADTLHPSVRGDYIECLEEKRREDEYEALEG